MTQSVCDAQAVLIYLLLLTFPQEAILVSMAGLRQKITTAFSDASNGLLKS